MRLTPEQCCASAAEVETVAAVELAVVDAGMDGVIGGGEMEVEVEAANIGIIASAAQPAVQNDRIETKQ